MAVSRAGLQAVVGGFQNLQNSFTQMQEMKQREEIFNLEKKKMETAAEEERLRREALERGAQGLQEAFAMPVGQQIAQGPPTAEGVSPMAGYTEADRQNAMLQAGLDLSIGGLQGLGNKIVDQTLYPDPGVDKEMLAAQLAKTKADTERINMMTLKTAMDLEANKTELASSQDFLQKVVPMADMFEAKAASAKTDAEKLRYKGVSLALRNAKNGKEVIDIIGKSMGGDEDMTNPFAVLTKKFGDPVKALETIQEIKNKGKKNDMSYGAALESTASAYYNKKRFSELTPEQQQNVIDMVEDRQQAKRLEQIEKEASTKPLSGTLATDVQKQNFTIQLAQRVLDQLKSEFVGKLQQYGTKWKDFAGQDPELSAFLSTWNRFTAWVLRPESGAAIGNLEREDILKMVGSLDSNPNSLIPKLTNFIDMVTDMRNSMATVGTTSAGQVIETLDKENQAARVKKGEPPKPSTASAPGTSSVPPVKPSGRTDINLPPEQMKEADDLLGKYGIPLK